MADRNPILKPVTDPSVQFEPAVQQQAIQDIVINGTAGGGGGGSAFVDNVKQGKVVSYTLSTRTGTATIDTQTVSFRDATLRLLVADDNIVLGKIANSPYDWIVVGVLKPDSGSGTAPNIGAVTIATGFPINTNAIPFPINPTLTGGSTSAQQVSLCYDMTNALGLGSDTIIGPALNASLALNLFSRTTGTATALYTLPTSMDDSHNIYIQSTGTIFIFTRPTGAINGNKTLYYRRAGAGSWTSQTYRGNAIAFDQSTGWLWFYNSGWFKMEPTDTSPVSVSFATSVVPTADSTEVMAGRGDLVVHISGDIYYKSSSDTVNWTTGGTYSTANWDSPRITYYKFPSTIVGSDGSAYYVRVDTGTATLHVRKVTVGGAVSDTDMGLATASYTVLGYLVTASDDVMFYGHALASLFGGSASDRIPFIAVFDPGTSTTTIVWYDLTRNSTSASDITMVAPVEISSGTFRWGVRDYAPTPDEFWVYEGIL